MTNKEVLEAYDSLIELSNRVTIPMPVSVTYAIARNKRILLPIVEDILNARQDILRKYGIPLEENPGYFKPKPGCEQELTKAYNELNEIFNEISLHKIPLDSLDGIELSIADMDLLYFMVDG